MDYAAIPTLYAGVQFRSRLEARWAALFDLISVTWRYEPIDLRGYIPDFVVTWIGGAEILVECKPALNVSDDMLVAAARKIDDSTWPDRAMIVGAHVGVVLVRIDSTQHHMPTHNPGIVLAPGARAWLPRPQMLEAAEPLWREAGNVVQWRKP